MQSAHAQLKTTGFVASGLWPDVEGWRLAARKETPEFLDVAEISSTFWLVHGFLRRAGRHGSMAGADARRYFRRLSPFELILTKHP